MPDRPIIFSAPMVRALLEGRKTQTRRLAKMRAGLTTDDLIAHGEKVDGGYRATRDMIAPPRFQVGDRLYVREHWRGRERMDAYAPRQFTMDRTRIHYIADGLPRACPLGEWKWGKHRQGMHMPRWAARLTLTVTDVRVERLQEISEADAQAEGLTSLTKDGGRVYKWGIPDRDGLPGNDDDGWHWRDWDVSAKAAYARLWNSLHAKPGERWDDDPWIVAVTFTVARGNIDEVPE